MFGFQKNIRFTPRLVLSRQGRQQSLSLGPNPIDNAVPCYPHDNIAGSLLCDECRTSFLPTVGHTLVSIWWLREQVCLLSTRCLVHQFEPSTSISRRFENIHRTINSPTVLAVVIIQARRWNCVQLLRLFVCQFAVSFNAFFEHVLPCRRTTQPILREAFHFLVIFQL